MNITIASMNANGELDEKVIKIAQEARRVVVQTDISDILLSRSITYESLDAIYKDAINFDDLIQKSLALLLRDKLLFIVLGDVYLNKIAAEVIKRVKQTGGHVTIVPGGDAALCMAFENGVLDNINGVGIYSAVSFERAPDTDLVIVINEIDTRLIASELKLKLSRYYGDEHLVYIADIRGKSGQIIPLCMLDGRQSYGYYTSIVIPPCALEKKQRYTFSDLVSIMDMLRSRNGCPWDNEQTHQSLKRYLIEESYEVLEAIDNDDIDALYDELGDVLLQVVFHAKVASQCGEFDITDITTAICKKMISRHVHIFGSVMADTPKDVIQSWEKIKKNEKGQQSQTEVLKDIPKNLPALMRSEKVQNKAAHVGFDFRYVSEAINKLKEEIAEVEVDMGNSEKRLEECGDLLFSAVNVSRLAGVEPESALHKATDKFIERFSQVERIASTENVDMHTCGIDKLNDLWDKAKKKNI
ncbi:MAG: nucleoside triphosphate pyrophosphohydrolase [Christensenellales bacterium]|jgi:tetrapyrrole methylase family protein/MazG family protein